MRELGRGTSPEDHSTDPRRLSHSSSGVLLGCERRYWHKIHETPYDADYVDNQKALRVGKGFHSTLEYCLHERSRFTNEIFNKAMLAEEIDCPQERGLILAMVLSYLVLHKRSMLTVIKCEIQVGDKHVIGYVDAIMVDENKNWWIVDLKTAGRLSNDLLSRLASDPQLNLYSFYKADIAKELDLDVNKFQGCRYRVTTKATLKMKPGENPSAYAVRIAGNVESYDIAIPYNEKMVNATRHRIEVLFDRTQEIAQAKEKEVMQNFNNCFNYFSPCAHWSRCHGATYSEAGEKINLISAKQMKPIIAGLEVGKNLTPNDDALFDLM